MAMVKKSISVTDHQDRWIKAQIQSGFSNRTPDDIIKAVIERKRSNGEL